MATFKHISSKNADYGAAEQYLTFEHDEFTMKPTLDGNGQIVPRTGYLISSLNCGDEDFAIACMRSNLKYGKNQKREDVKSHHYIISFDPRDAQDNGLTVDRAQQLGEQFCKEHFPGHQALVCTHPDGHNHSGNIHVHIVINSLRRATGRNWTLTMPPSGKSRIYHYRYVEASITNKYQADRVTQDKKVWDYIEWYQTRQSAEAVWEADETEAFRQAYYCRIIRSFAICCRIHFYHRENGKCFGGKQQYLKSVLGSSPYAEAFEKVRFGNLEWRLKALVLFVRCRLYGGVYLLHLAARVLSGG